MCSLLHRSLIARFSVILFPLVLATACNGFFSNGVLQSITISPASPTISVGSTQNTQQMTATGVNDDGSTSTVSNVTWKSSDPTKATIDSSGLLKAVAAGTTMITATSGSISGTTTATVLGAALNSITISGGSTSGVTPGTTVTFTATGNLADGSHTTLSNVSWTSSDQTNAPITSTGSVTVSSSAPSESVTITATAGTITATTTLTIL
jgi:hypothetical protein